MILPAFGNETLNKLGDSAEIGPLPGKLLFTTDSYVVKPLFFPGGDIGKLAVCGTLNDLAAAGARPAALSFAMIIEEHFEMRVLEQILFSASAAARDCGIELVTGDTKVVEAGSADGLFINTSGLGVMIAGSELAASRIEPADRILVTGPIGDHGLAILSQREGLGFEGGISSDCAAVTPLAEAMIAAVGRELRFMRDPTRGGLAAVLNEIAEQRRITIEIEQQAVPVRPQVRAAAEMLGLDVLAAACEGRLVAVVSEAAAPACLEACRKNPLGRGAAIIGRATDDGEPVVEMKTAIGGRRVIPMPYGRELPRIC
jgi:hydrogenase expression/formation protein HypE